jgi:hypothetical protein
LSSPVFLTVPGSFEFFPGGSELYLDTLLRLLDLGGFGKFPGGSRFSIIAGAIPDLRVVIPPSLLTVIFFLPALNSTIHSPSHSSIDSYLLESKSNPNIQVWSCEKKQIESLSCVL